MNKQDDYKMITSRSNPAFRQLEKIRKAPQRAEPPALFLEGLRLCADAISSGVEVQQVILSEQGAERPEIRSLVESITPVPPTILLSDYLFARLAATEEPQGIALLGTPPLTASEHVPAVADGLYLVLEGVSDPGNVGTLIRTADAFAFTAVLVMPDTASPFGDKAVRSSMGSCFHIPIITIDSIAGLRDYLDQAGLALYAADLDGSSLNSDPFTRPGALLVGNEARGISTAAREASDVVVTIPMPGQAESLNAAAAGAVLCYSLRKAFPL